MPQARGQGCRFARRSIASRSRVQASTVKKGVLPCRMVGAHHRIPMGAVIAYKREQEPRRRSLEALSAETQDLGH